MPDTATTPERIRDYSRLTQAEIGLALRLIEAGKTQTQAAEIIGCCQSTISRLVLDFTDTRIAAKARLANASLKVTEAAIEGSVIAAAGGKPEAALEILDRLEVAVKRQPDGGRGSQVNIVIGMPGQPAGHDPILVSPGVTRELSE
jgi:transcriptional regulator with XRE-family HTH domain